jgi:hypothetical protein
MSYNELLEQAKAWCNQCAKEEKHGPVWTLQDGIDAFLAGANAEREACAKIADSFLWYDHPSCGPDEGNEFIAKMIRERSNGVFSGPPSGGSAGKQG